MLGLLWLLLSYQVKDKFIRICCVIMAAGSFTVALLEWVRQYWDIGV